MKKIHLFMLFVAVVAAGCGKSNFYDKYPPEILYYQNADVENADFNSIILASGVTQFTVKARVSAPYVLKEIKVYKGTKVQPEKELVATYTDFKLNPNVLNISNTISNITGETVVETAATDGNGHVTKKLFVISVTP